MRSTVTDTVDLTFVSFFRLGDFPLISVNVFVANVRHEGSWLTFAANVRHECSWLTFVTKVRG